MEAVVEIKIEPSDFNPSESENLPKIEIVQETLHQIKIKTENITQDTSTSLPLISEPCKIQESELIPKTEVVEDESQNVPPPLAPPDLGQGQGSLVSESFTNTLPVEKGPIKKKKKKPLIGRIETVRKTYRKFFCKLCMAQVPSLEKLVIHLDREHKIRVKGPARVVVGEDRDDKEDLKVTSDLLKSIDNMSRTTEPLSESESSDEESGSEFDPAEEEEGLTSDSDDDEETSYFKFRTRTQNRMFHQEGVWTARIKSQRDDPDFKVMMETMSQCKFCFEEVSLRPRFRFVKAFHMRQHSDGVYKLCPHCSMPFLYEHQLDKHLEDLAVPVVPPGLSRAEGEDLLYTIHPCPGGLVSSGSIRFGCGAAFANRKCLLFHMTRAHDHYHRCPTCEKPYMLHSELRKHIQRSHNWEGRMMNCPVPNCDKLFNTKKGISSHFIHIHSKEEKDQYYPNNQFNDRNEPTPAVRHTTPQTFWRMINAQWDKTRAFKIKAERAKRTSIWEKPQKFTPSSPVTVQVKLENPAPKPEINQSPKPVFTKWPSTTPTSFPNISASGNIRWGNLAGVSSIPSKEYTGGQLSKKPLHKLFLILCGFCARSFRNATTRNRHVIATHKIDTSLERPYKCPAEGCDYDRTELKSLLKHIRRFHPVSVEEALVRKSLEEDKATAPEGEEEFFQSILRAKTEVEEEANNKNQAINSSQEIKTKPSNPPAPQKTVNRVATATATASSSYPRHRRPAPFSRDNKSLIRGRNTFKHMYQRGPTAQRVRAVLETFTLGSGYYCPECPIHSRKSMTTTWSVHRHLAGFHPYSKILKDPDSEKLQSTNQDVEETRLNPTLETNTNQEERDSDENMEVEPEGIEDEEDQDIEHDSEAVDDSDFITRASDPSMLAIFRRFLRKYELYPHIPNNYTASCPICKEANVDATFARTHSLQDHILKVHPGCELLRKSNLVDLSPNQLTGSHRNKQKNLIVHRKMILTGLPGVGNITKTKANSLSGRTPGQKGLLPSPLNCEVQKYKTECGTGFYCPDCASLGVVQTFTAVFPVIRHLRSFHPDSELLKLSYGRRSSISSQGQNQAAEKSDDEGDAVGSDNEIEVAPETGENCEDEDKLEPSKGVGRKNLIVNRKMKLTGFRGVDHITKMKSKAIHFFRGARRKKIPGPLTRLMSKYKTKSGKTFYCPDCASLDTERTFSSVGNLIRHMRTFHPDSEVFKISQGQRFRGRKQSSESEESGDEVYPGLDNVDDGSDSEIEVAPETEELCEDDDNEEDSLSKSSSSCIDFLPAVEAVHGRHMKEVKIKLEQIPPLKRVTIEHVPQPKRHTDGRWYCALCPEEGRPNYSLVCNLNRHVTRKHLNSPPPSRSKSVSVPLPSVKFSFFDLNSVAEAQAKIWTEIEKICSNTNPKKIQCPLCPEITIQGKKKPFFLSYHYLCLHFERCRGWKALYPQFPHVYLLQGRCWSCSWCTKSVFLSKLSLIAHVRNEHSEVTSEENEAHAERIRAALYTCHWCQKDCQNSNGFRAHRCSGPSHLKTKIKDEPLQEELSSSTSTAKFNVEGVVITSKSPLRRKSTSRPKRDSAQFYQPNYKDGSSSDEDFSGIQFKPEIYRSSPIIKPPVPRPDPDELHFQKDNELETIECSICSKKCQPGRGFSVHKIWHMKRGDIFDDDEQVNKRPRLSEDAQEEEEMVIDNCEDKMVVDRGDEDGDVLEEEVPPDFCDEEGMGNQMDDPLSQENELAMELGVPTFSNLELESALEVMDDEIGSVVEENCSFCGEWFTSSQEKADHIIKDHSSRGHQS